MTDLERKAAEMCGINLQGFFWREPINYTFKWSLDDPRCLKIFRDWWMAQAVNERSVVFGQGSVRYTIELVDGWKDVTGKTERECIEQIVEASDE